LKIKENILNILGECRIEGSVVYLPEIQLDRKAYQEVNKCLESIGGKWNRKAKGHVFTDSPSELMDNLILTGETTDLKKEYQFFPTPKEIAQRMVKMAEIQPNDFLLEPSAGQGAIADEFPKLNAYMLIELNPNNHKALLDKGYTAMQRDFLTFNVLGLYDKIIMNPPFTKQQDIDHILHAFKLLKEGGILVSIVSESPFFRSNRKSLEFRFLLESYDAEVVTLPEGAFKESGTMVRTRIIKLRK
jgi:type I restriction-modification system DNA methylase subunit